MLTIPKRSETEIQSNQSFEAMLWALSYPGRVRNLPEPGESMVIEALIDRECSVYTADPLLLPQILQKGAEISDLNEADHAFLGVMKNLQALDHVLMGSDLYPDGGATLVARVTIGSGQKLRLTGPGVFRHQDIYLNGLPDGFWKKRCDIMRYPIGFDLFLIDEARIIGVPRSTKVELL
tara:strand:- start:6914 stop:7450 length:537 start_codon:yes stop_codon:yes gene_type:complete